MMEMRGSGRDEDGAPMIEAAEALALFRVAPGRYRFTHRRLRPFVVACVADLAFAVVSVAGFTELDEFGFVLWGLTWFGAVLLTLAIYPGKSWLELEDSADAWTIRRRSLLWTSDAVIAKDRIAIATVNVTRTNERLPAQYQHHVELYQRDDLPFVRERTPPLAMAVGYGLPVSVLVEICRLLAPGYSRTAYLLSAATDDPVPERRGGTRRG